MNRDAFIRWLARLVTDGAITEAEARELLARFEAGELPDGFTLPGAPAPSDEKDGDEETVLLILAALLLLLRRRTLAGAPLLAVNPIQTRFNTATAQLARQLASGQITLPAWQAQMATQLRTLYTSNVLAATQGQIAHPQLSSIVNSALRRELAYLSRFADHMALRYAETGAYSAGAIASRAGLYAGNARGLYFEQWEQAALARGEIGPGWVVDYISRDDGVTCFNCLDADHRGPYLPGRPHPLPGVVCLGRARCRCRLSYRYDPVTFRRLGG